MKIGIIKETKFPVDNRVAFTPDQIKKLHLKYPYVEFKIQSSDIRAYSDEEYKAQGIEVVDNLNDCDFILGIKEADVSVLRPEKHYMFFGHIAKMQPYNKPLFKALIENKITFSDYEYLVDDNGNRLVAFGWYAGVVGLYYTLWGWGLKKNLYRLPKPHKYFSLQELISNLRNINTGTIKIVVTGNGHVSQGAQYILQQIGAKEISTQEFITRDNLTGIIYCVAKLEDLVAPNIEHHKFDRNEFMTYPERYHSVFDSFAVSADILLSCHFWGNNHPVYLTEDSFNLPGFRIKMIGDVTCDIKGSIKSTLRSSTHDKPFYDYNPITGKEEEAFSSFENITVMAVDTCPNALARETSEYFGEQLIKYVLCNLLESDSDKSAVLDKATILCNGKLTERFSYLAEYTKLIL